MFVVGLGITKPPPPATGKPKPRKPFPTTDNSEESVQTKASESPTAVNDGRGQEESKTPSTEKDDVSEKVKKPARKAPPPRKAPPMPTKKEGDEQSPGTTRPKAPPPRKSPPQPIKAVDSKQSPKLSPKTTPTPIKAPPPHKGPPPPTTNKDTPTDKESPILISKSDNDKPVARAPPPKKGPPPPPSQSTPPTDSASITRKPAPRAPPPRKSVTEITKEGDSSPKLNAQTSPASGRGKPPSPKLKSVDNHRDSVLGSVSASNREPSDSSNKPSPTVVKSQKPSKPSPPSAAPRNTKPAPPKPGPPKPTPPNPSAAKQAPPKPGPPKPTPPNPSAVKHAPPKPGPPKPGPPKPSAAPRKPGPSRYMYIIIKCVNLIIFTHLYTVEVDLSQLKDQLHQYVLIQLYTHVVLLVIVGSATIFTTQTHTGSSFIQICGKHCLFIHCTSLISLLPPFSFSLPPFPLSSPIFLFLPLLSLFSLFSLFSLSFSLPSQCSEPHGIATSNREAEEADDLSYMVCEVVVLSNKIATCY